MIFEIGMIDNQKRQVSVSRSWAGWVTGKTRYSRARTYESGCQPIFAQLWWTARLPPSARSVISVGVSWVGMEKKRPSRCKAFDFNRSAQRCLRSKSSYKIWIRLTTLRLFPVPGIRASSILKNLIKVASSTRVCSLGFSTPLVAITTRKNAVKATTNWICWPEWKAQFSRYEYGTNSNVWI